MVAAMKNDRNSIGIETEKLYCDQIVRRLEREHSRAFPSEYSFVDIGDQD